VVAAVAEKRFISSVMAILAQCLPLDKRLQFLKRVRIESGKAHVLICAGGDVDAAMDRLQPEADRLAAAGLEFPLLKHEIYCEAPITRQQFDTIRLAWPCHFHEDKGLELLLKQSRPDVWSAASFEKHVNRVDRLLQLAGCRQSAALVVDPGRDVIVAEAAETEGDHPLRHAAMNVIDAVAHAQGGGAWPRPVPTAPDMNDKSYLLTGYDVYLSREPCCMCAMALVHSRASRVFYGTGDKDFGALGSAVRLHTVDGLNHLYEVFCVEKIR
jgi:tRNA-specific adenosine deaminase 3